MTSDPTVAGDYTVTVTAHDGADSDAQEFLWSVAAPHTVSVAAPGDQSNVEGDVVSLQVQASTRTDAATAKSTSRLVRPGTNVRSCAR